MQKQDADHRPQLEGRGRQPSRTNGSRSSGNPYTAIAQDKPGREAINWGVTAAPETFRLDANGVAQYRLRRRDADAEIWEREFPLRIQGKQPVSCWMRAFFLSLLLALSATTALFTDITQFDDPAKQEQYLRLNARASLHAVPQTSSIADSLCDLGAADLRSAQCN